MFFARIYRLSRILGWLVDLRWYFRWVYTRSTLSIKYPSFSMKTINRSLFTKCNRLRWRTSFHQTLSSGNGKGILRDFHANFSGLFSVIKSLLKCMSISSLSWQTSNDRVCERDFMRWYKLKRRFQPKSVIIRLFVRQSNNSFNKTKAWQTLFPFDHREAKRTHMKSQPSHTV